MEGVFLRRVLSLTLLIVNKQINQQTTETSDFHSQGELRNEALDMFSSCVIVQTHSCLCARSFSLCSSC